MILARELNENHKKIRMLKNGSKDLDEILSIRIVGSQHYGLGYKASNSSVSQTLVRSLNFVKSKTNHEAETTNLEQ